MQAYLHEYDESFLESVLSVSRAIDSTNNRDEGEQFPEINAGDRIGPYVVIDRLGVTGVELLDGELLLDGHGEDTRQRGRS